MCTMTGWDKELGPIRVDVGLLQYFPLLGGSKRAFSAKKFLPPPFLATLVLLTPIELNRKSHDVLLSPKSTLRSLSLDFRFLKHLKMATTFRPERNSNIVV